MRNPDDIPLLRGIEIAEATLHSYPSVIGPSNEPYLNHIRRVLTYANWFQSLNAEDRKLVETALAFHDLGFWTDQRIDYLSASSHLVQSAIKESDAAVVV